MSNDIIPGEVINVDFGSQAADDQEPTPEIPTPNYHTILEVWREVLKPALAESQEKVNAGWAVRIVSEFPFIELHQMNDFRDSYFGKILELAKILDEEIASDSDALSYDNPEEDVLENREHYINVITDWQCRILSWELAWDCTDPLAGVEIGAISSVQKMFFGPTGIVPHLDSVGFQFGEAEQAQLAERLQAMKEGL